MWAVLRLTNSSYFSFVTLSLRLWTNWGDTMCSVCLGRPVNWKQWLPWLVRNLTTTRALKRTIKQKLITLRTICLCLTKCYAPSPPGRRPRVSFSAPRRATVPSAPPGTTRDHLRLCQGVSIVAEDNAVINKVYRDNYQVKVGFKK